MLDKTLEKQPNYKHVKELPGGFKCFYYGFSLCLYSIRNVVCCQEQTTKNLTFYLTF